MSLHHGLRSSVSGFKDPEFTNVSLLLLGNGTNAGQNNTFIDGSSNNFTVTRNGNTTQGAFSPFGYNWSNYFDGTGDYLTFNGSSSCAFGTGDFTVEFWLFKQNSSDTTLFDARNPESANPWGIDINSNIPSWYNGSSNNGSTAISLNTWVHLAFCRSGTTHRIFINGSQTHSFTDSTNIGTMSTVARIGSNLGNSRYLNGYISNLRIVKGTALFTADFVPSKSPLTAVTNTSLLTCQSNRFVDNSANALAITRYGDTKVSNFAPFAITNEYDKEVNGGSGYFDGSGDYLSYTGNSITSSDFTIEAWVYLNKATSNHHVFSFGTNEPNRYSIFRENTTNKWSLGIVNSSSYTITNGTSSAPAGQWYHLAFVRSGTTNYLYVNGNREASNTASLNSGTSRYIGGNFGLLSGDYLDGYISSFRVVTSAVYTGTTYTIPTSPLQAITGTETLLNFTNSAIVDSSGKNDIETIGNAQLSTSTKKFGTGSISLDGSSDYLFMSPQPWMFLGNTYTIEGWIYLNSTTGYKPIFSISASNQAAFAVLQIAMNGTAMDFAIRPTNSGAVTTISGGTFSTGTWYHFAACVNGGSGKLFIDGTQVGSTTTMPDMAFTIFGAAIGCAANGYNSSTETFNGFIDDLRVTKRALYTANFTPPKSQLPAR